LQIFPEGPWKEISKFIRTRTSKQAQAHAQKHREKIARRKRGLKRKSRDQETNILTLESNVDCAAAKPVVPIPFDDTKYSPIFEQYEELISAESILTADCLPSIEDSLDYFIEVMELPSDQYEF